MVLVSDAMSGASSEPGRFRLGERFIEVEGGVAQTADGTIAGSLLSLDQAIRNVVGWGIPLESALAAATEHPAQSVGRPELASLVPGSKADVVVLDDRLEIKTVLVGGRPCR
jgi:N-acetylglucosamine-6-phosphate deacetylase